LSSALDIATADLLNPGGLGEAELQATLGQLMDRHLDLAGKTASSKKAASTSTRVSA
jgi:hypothetical protein